MRRGREAAGDDQPGNRQHAPEVAVVVDAPGDLHGQQVEEEDG
jgi:hypothetical protein